MLKKLHRLASGRILNAQALSTEFFVLKFAKNNQEISRFGFLVSKKVDSRATERNRLRRQTRRCIEDRLSQVLPGFDFLFILKKEALGKKTDQICNLVEGVLKKEKLYK
ncbi:ribonuclease P protein component [Patescibacteria group bacterium]|nr:ribonuclease P protein component [Patescibacteria group bacterium]